MFRRSSLNLPPDPSSPNDLYEFDDDILVLDVGGTKFRTTLRTVRSFDKIFQVGSSQEYGRILIIDRDPEVFGYILNFLRDGSVIVPRNGCILARIKREAQFYGITDLVAKVDAILHHFRSDYLQITSE